MKSACRLGYKIAVDGGFKEGEISDCYIGIIWRFGESVRFFMQVVSSPGIPISGDRHRARPWAEAGTHRWLPPVSTYLPIPIMPVSL